MKRKAIGTQTDLKNSNYSRVLSLIQKEGIISKSDISKRLGLSIVTVTKVCDSMCDRGFCRYSELLESTGGRRPVGVEFLADSRYIAVVDLSNEGFVYAALADLNWNIVSESRREIIKDDIAVLLDSIQEIVSELLQHPDRSKKSLLGCVASIPGVENKRSGEIDTCNIEVLKRISLSGRLKKSLGVPVLVENDADLAALGLQQQSGIDNLMYLHFTEGIGLGVVVDGKLHTGALGFAGELASFLAPDFDGGSGVLEDFASQPGFLDYYLNNRKGLPDETSTRGLLDHFIQNIESSDGLEKKMIEVVCRQLGNLISLLMDLFNPDIVILGGAERSFLDLFLTGITAHVREHSTLARFSDVEITYREGGSHLIVTGGASLFFKSWLNQFEF